MKNITAIIEHIGQGVFKLSIKDRDAMLACGMRFWLQFSPQDVLWEANQKLNRVGYNITEVIKWNTISKQSIRELTHI